MTARKLDETPSKVKCRGCGWEVFANAKRMADHKCKSSAQREHPEASCNEDVAHSPVSQQENGSQAQASPSAPSDPSGPAFVQPALKKTKVQLLSHFLDHKLTPEEQVAAEREQALMCVKNGFSFNSQARPWTHSFYRYLRSDYKPPSVYTLEKHIDELFAETKNWG